MLMRIAHAPGASPYRGEIGRHPAMRCRVTVAKSDGARRISLFRLDTRHNLPHANGVCSSWRNSSLRTRKRRDLSRSQKPGAIPTAS